MKQIEEKLDSIEEVLTILIKKVSGLENLQTEQRTNAQKIQDTLLLEIKAVIDKLPSGNLLMSEIHGLKKNVSQLSKEFKKQPVTVLDWRSKGFLLSTAVVLILMTCAYTSILFLSRNNTKLRGIERKYLIVERIDPNLTSWIDSINVVDRRLSNDRIKNAWFRRNSFGN